jgi:hypothetical protein
MTHLFSTEAIRIHVIASPPMMADSLLLGEATSPRKRDQKVVFEDVEVKLTSRDKQLSVLLVTKMVNTSFISNKDGQYVIY